jgi:hypothetical protein
MSGYTVGEPAALAVYVEGTVEEIADDTVTIAGHVLPRRIGGGVRTLSTSWPETTRCDGDHSECEESHCAECYDCRGEGPVCGSDWRTVDGIEEAVERAHSDAGHAGPYRYCADLICTAVREAGE